MPRRNRTLLSEFLLRWFVSSLGLWVAAGIIGESIDYQSRLRVIVISGLILAIINTLIRPVVVILSLPIILFSLGLFVIVINGFMVVLASKLYSPLQIESFWAAMLAGMIIGLVNYLVITILEGNKGDLKG